MTTTTRRLADFAASTTTADLPADVVDYIRKLPRETPAKVVALRGNHEDAWLRVIDRGWPEFVLPPPNGCLAALRSFTGGPPPLENEQADGAELEAMLKGSFFPPDVVKWMRDLPYWYEDEPDVTGILSGRFRTPTLGCCTCSLSLSA